MFNKKLSLLALVLLVQSASVFAYDNATACKAAKYACSNTHYKYGGINLSTTGGGGLDTVYVTCVNDDDTGLGDEEVTFTIDDQTYTGWAQKNSGSRFSTQKYLECKGPTIGSKGTCHRGKKDWKNCKF